MRKSGANVIITILLTIVVLAGGYFYHTKTLEVRRYKAEIKQLNLISEHQRLEIEVTKQRIEFNALQKKPPVINLSPPPEREISSAQPEGGNK
jgi:hypothetical protein